jgi:hypothetical protein
MSADEQLPAPPAGNGGSDPELRRLAEDLLAMSVDDRLETLRRFVALRDSAAPAPR